MIAAIGFAVIVYKKWKELQGENLHSRRMQRDGRDPLRNWAGIGDVQEGDTLAL